MGVGCEGGGGWSSGGCPKSKRTAVLSVLTTHPTPTHPARPLQSPSAPLPRHPRGQVRSGAPQPDTTNAIHTTAAKSVKSKLGPWHTGQEEGKSLQLPPYGGMSQVDFPWYLAAHPAIRLILQPGHHGGPVRELIPCPQASEEV